MSEWSWPSWDEWLATLPADGRDAAEALRDQFQRLGADEPEQWARSEVSEAIPQLARFAFLRAVWREVESWRDPERMQALLPDATEDCRRAAHLMAARAAFEVALGVVQLLDDEEDIAATEPLPGWQLVETTPDGARTGRMISGLHESVLETDPRHIEAADIRGW